MAIDNSLYDSLQNAYVKIQDYFNNNKLGPEHSAMMMKHEELAELLEKLDIEARKRELSHGFNNNDLRKRGKRDSVHFIDTNSSDRVDNSIDNPGDRSTKFFIPPNFKLDSIV